MKIKLTVEDWKAYLEDAKKLKALYDRQNEVNPSGIYIYGGLDNIMLRLFERRHGIIITDMKTKGISDNTPSLYLYAIQGRFWGDEVWLRHEHTDARNFEFWNNGNTYNVVIDDFERRTIARLTISLCDILAARSEWSPPGFKSLFPVNNSKYLLAIKESARQYV